MANIRQVTSKVDSLTPSDRAVSGLETAASAMGQKATATAIAAGHIQQSYNEIGRNVGQGISQAGQAVVKHITDTQTLKALQLSAEATANAAQDWNATVAADAQSDVHDPNLAADWKKEKLGPALDAIGQTLGTQEGQQWWATHRVAIEQHFNDTTTADVSTLAGQQSVQDFIKTGNSAQSLAYNSPSDAALARNTMETAKRLALSQLGANASPQAINAINEHFDTQQAAITIAQGRGAVDAAPDPKAAAAQFLASPEAATLLTDTQRASIRSYGEQVTNSRQTDALRAQAEAVRQAKEAVEAKAVSIYAAGIGKGPAGTWAPPADFNTQLAQLTQMPHADVAELRAMGNMGKTAVEDQISGRLIQSDRGVYNDFASRLALPPTDPQALTKTEVFQARASGKLSNEDRDFFVSAVDGVKADPARQHLYGTLNTFIQAMKPTITGADLNGMPPPGAAEKWWHFQSDMHLAVETGLKHGMTPAQVEAQLLTPDSKFFLGHNLSFYANDPGDLVGTLQPWTSTGARVSFEPGGKPGTAAPAAAAGPAPKLSQDQVNNILFGK